MAYILDLVSGVTEPDPSRISLEQYVLESSYIPRFLGQVVKDKALVVYQVLFNLSWFETGRGELVIPWARVGSYIRSEQGNIIDSNTTVKRRLPDLFDKKCITVERQRGGANAVTVHLPSQIPACAALLQEAQEPVPEPDDSLLDHYTDPTRRLKILERDGRHCQYCLVEIDDESFVLDHLLPVSQGGSNRKNNLVAACEACNGRRGEQEAIAFLNSNYRNQLISQDEFLTQRSRIESLLKGAPEGAV